MSALSSPLQTFVILYIAFRIKHFICDFVLQTNWIANNKGGASKEGYKALGLHVMTHAVGTLIVSA